MKKPLYNDKVKYIYNLQFFECAKDGDTNKLVESLDDNRDSFFLSRHWILNWLKHSEQSGRKYILLFLDKDKPVGLAIFNATTVKRRRFFTRKILSLFDNSVSGYYFGIEYNQILSSADIDDSIHNDLLQFLSNLDNIEELHLNFATEKTIQLLENNVKLYPKIHMTADESSICRQVDLSGFTEPDTYLRSLSRNRRTQIKKSIEHYSKYGEINENVAQDIDEALSYFDQLGKLHESKWNKLGKTGAFANQKWVNFHKSVIKSAFDEGKIILYRLTAGELVIGLLYITLDNNVANVIQTGFMYDDSKYGQPGFITHYSFIRYAIRNKYQVYDFLAGDTQYKKSLSNKQDKVYSIILQKKSISMYLENLLVKYIRKFRSFRRT